MRLMMLKSDMERLTLRQVRKGVDGSRGKRVAAGYQLVLGCVTYSFEQQMLYACVWGDESVCFGEG